MDIRRTVLISIALFPSLPIPAISEEAPRPPAAPPIVRIGEGDLLIYKGSIAVSRREPGEEPEAISATLEVGYLGLGRGEGSEPGAPPGERVLLFRSGESQEMEDVAFSEAVSLLQGPGLDLRPEFPAEDRAQRVSIFSFNHMPFGIFPSLSSPEPGEWRGPARLQLFSPAPREVPCRHRVELLGAGGSLRYTVEAESGQTLSLIQDGVEVAFVLSVLRNVHELSLSKGRLLSFASTLEARFPAAGNPGGSEERRVAIELTLSESQKLDGNRWAKLRREAGLLREIERTLFVELNPDGAESKADSFEKENPSSRLESFASGLGRQALAVWPIANERRLYGKPAPDFTLTDIAGGKFALSSSLPGKVTLLSFWTLGCLACRAEAPCLTKLDGKYRSRGFQAIAVNAESGDAPEKVAEFARKLMLTHTILVGGAQAAQSYKIDGMVPTNFWIDHRGRVVRRETGFRPEMEGEFERSILELLSARDSELKGSSPGSPGAPPPTVEPEKNAPSKLECP